MHLMRIGNEVINLALVRGARFAAKGDPGKAPDGRDAPIGRDGLALEMGDGRNKYLWDDVARAAWSAIVRLATDAEVPDASGLLWDAAILAAREAGLAPDEGEIHDAASEAREVFFRLFRPGRAAGAAPTGYRVRGPSGPVPVPDLAGLAGLAAELLAAGRAGRFAIEQEGGRVGEIRVEDGAWRVVFTAGRREVVTAEGGGDRPSPASELDAVRRLAWSLVTWVDNRTVNADPGAREGAREIAERLDALCAAAAPPSVDGPAAGLRRLHADLMRLMTAVDGPGEVSDLAYRTSMLIGIVEAIIRDVEAARPAGDGAGFVPTGGGIEPLPR